VFRYIDKTQKRERWGRLRQNLKPSNSLASKLDLFIYHIRWVNAKDRKTGVLSQLYSMDHNSISFPPSAAFQSRV